MKYFLLSFSIFVITHLTLYGQSLITAKNFGVNTPFLEPEERILSEKIGKEGIISLAKNKGTTTGASFYLLEFYRPDLSLKWSTTVRIADQENILHLKVLNEQVVIYTVAHNEKQKTTKLQASIYNKFDGQPVSEKILLEHNIDSWFSADQKGAVKRDLNTIILSGSKKDYVTPLEYRYQIDYSPDDSLLLFYRYDFSKPILLAETYVFDQEHQLVKKAILPIDKGYINHELQLSPEGNIFILNTRSDGAVAVIHYNLEEKESRFLELSPSNSHRNHFRLEVDSKYKAVVSYLNYRENFLEGLTSAMFNFLDEKIEWVNHQELNQPLDSLSTASGKESYKNYALLDRVSFMKGNLYFLEQREYVSTGKQLSSQNEEHVNYWKPGKSQLHLGNILVLYLNSDDSLEWVSLIPKNQVASSEEGLISIGFDYAVFENEIDILYGEGVGSLMKLNLVKIDSTGKKIQKELPNEHNVILLRPYTHWLDDQTLIIAGKKGKSGKSSILLKYKIP